MLPAFAPRFLVAAALLAAGGPFAAEEDLPGEEVVTPLRPAAPVAPRPAAPPADSATGENWLAPSVHEQLARDPVLVSFGKGALFIPTFSEPRREPEVAVFDPATGDLIATGQTGHRILLDAGTYEIRFGSGAGGRRMRKEVRVEDGITSVVYPDWGGLLVETLSENGEYLDEQYDVVRMGD